MAKLIKCDRCSKISPEQIRAGKVFNYRIEAIEYNRDIIRTNYDLCPNCFKEVLKLIEKYTHSK